MGFKMPPVMENASGEIRKAGFELEFSNLELDQAVKIVTDLFGGEEHAVSRYYREVKNTSLGDFTVKLDTRLLAEKSYKKPFDKINFYLEEVKMGKETLDDKIGELLASVSSVVIPNEIVTPPVSIEQVGVYEKLRRALYYDYASGTKGSFAFAFAMHINPEVPDLSASVLLNYLRAFLLLYPWLLRQGRIDFTRRMTAFINPFPRSYILKILHPDYKPDLYRLFTDYHAHNPDRNRPFDLYPVFAEIFPEEIEKLEGVGNVKSRPTFHYRLPNSEVGNRDWHLEDEWNRWIAVEELANDGAKLTKLCKKYLKLRKRTLWGFEKKWAKRMEDVKDVD